MGALLLRHTTTGPPSSGTVRVGVEKEITAAEIQSGIIMDKRVDVVRLTGCKIKITQTITMFKMLKTVFSSEDICIFAMYYPIGYPGHPIL